MGVLDAQDAPDTALEDLRVLTHILGRHDERLDTQVGEVGHVDVAVLVKPRGHLVDDRVGAQLPDFRFDDLGLVRAHVVVQKNAADALEAALHGHGVVGGAVHAQQVLQHEGGHVGAALHEGREVFAHDLAGEMLHGEPIHRVGLEDVVDRRGRGYLVHGLVYGC